LTFKIFHSVLTTKGVFLDFLPPCSRLGASAVLIRFNAKTFAMMLGLATSMATYSSAEESTVAVKSVRLVATAVQDEPRKLPKDITALISRNDRRVRFELVKLAGTAGQSLAGTSVTVIDSKGQSQKLEADSTGIATLENAAPGLVAVVIGSEQGHSALPLAIRESEEAGAAGAPAPVAPTVKLPLVDIPPTDVVRYASSAVPASGSASYGDIDSDFISSGSVDVAYDYRIRLSSDGRLTGQVLSLVRDGLTSHDVAGTNIIIYSGGAVVAQATADAEGYFQVNGVAEGVHGLVAVGPGGYAAFGFETYAASAVASNQSANGMTLVSFAAQADGDVLPVVLVPPALVEPMVVSLQQSYGPLLGGGAAGAGGLGALGLAAPLAGAGGFGGGPGGGFGGAGAGAGGIGGLGALGLLGAAIPVAVIAAEANNDDEPGDSVSPSN
jgi:hypothetical protein